MWHMPHGISPLQSTPRNSRCCSPLWDTSTSPPISTVTQPSYHIDILSYKLSASLLSWSPISSTPVSTVMLPSPWAGWLLPLLALLLISNEGTCHVTTSTLANTLFKQEPHYFYCRNGLLARNNLNNSSTPLGPFSSTHECPKTLMHLFACRLRATIHLS